MGRAASELGGTSCPPPGGPASGSLEAGLYGSSLLRSKDAFSMRRALSFVPSGTRNGKVQENSGTDPTSTNVAAVLYALSVVSVIDGRFIGAGL